MDNHYHLCLETLEANLVEGMKWLQSTFANRFNRFRKTNGHVFQGRYRAIVLDGDSVGPVCHYIHLNPVRAGIVQVEGLQRYSDCSFAGLWYPSRRRRHESYEAALESGGGLSDREGELAASKKGEPWKVAVARHLRERCLAPHRWIAANLQMGSPSYVQSLVSRHRRKPAGRDWEILRKHEKLD